MIRTAIVQGSLAPGTRLVERDLSDQFNMSRIPVREAIERLVDEGLLAKIPHRGIFVTSPTRDEIEEISSLRIALEQFVAERVVTHLRTEHEVSLRAIVEQMREAASPQDAERIYELDLEFHRALWEIAGHTLLLEVVSNLRSRISWFLHEAAHTGGFQFDIYVAAHEHLLRVLQDRDVAAARAAIADHIKEARLRILSTYDSIPRE
jgi:DNA-binding GntR family transcriptional regulator